MMRTVQLAVADAVYERALREGLSHSGPWDVRAVECPDPELPSVLVVDESAFARMLRPLAHPERVVLISRQEPELLAQAWEAGIVSVVSSQDSPATALLAIMAATLRITNLHPPAAPSGISPNILRGSAPITPQIQTSRSGRCKTR